MQSEVIRAIYAEDSPCTFRFSTTRRIARSTRRAERTLRGRGTEGAVVCEHRWHRRAMATEGRLRRHDRDRGRGRGRGATNGGTNGSDLIVKGTHLRMACMACMACILCLKGRTTRGDQGHLMRRGSALHHNPRRYGPSCWRM